MYQLTGPDRYVRDADQVDDNDDELTDDELFELVEDEAPVGEGVPAAMKFLARHPELTPAEAQAIMDRARP